MTATITVEPAVGGQTVSTFIGGPATDSAHLGASSYVVTSSAVHRYSWPESFTSASSATPSNPERLALLLIEGANKPVHVRIQHEEGHTSIIDTKTGVFGIGETLAAATIDFRTALLEHLDVLTRQPMLSEDLQYQLETIRTYFTAS